MIMSRNQPAKCKYQVRDELRMTLMAYQTLYESSIAFGIRKALKAEQGESRNSNSEE